MVVKYSPTALAAAPVCELAPYQPGKPLEDLEREFGIRDAIKLASNENPFTLPEAVRAAVVAGVADLQRYPDGAGFRLRAALAAHHGIAPDCITLGNGSNDVLVLLAETFLTPAVNAIYDQYSFVVYRLAVQATGATARVANSHPRAHVQPLGHDLDAMLALVDNNTRLIFVANPNNPTGTWVDRNSLQFFLQQLPPHVIVVLDEAYHEYARGDDFPDASQWLTEFPNLVVTRTFSKAYGLAGLRVGYALSSAAIAGLLNRVRQPFNVNSLGQRAAFAALGEQAWVEECCSRIRAERERLRNTLADMGIATLPSRGNFLLAEIPDAASVNEFLLRQGVIVRPVVNYGLPDYLRISVGLPAENDRFLAALAAFMPHGSN
jgi:histidinol-phosphate aminotransferase